MTPICVEHLKLELLEQCTKEALPELLERLSRHNQASQYVGLCSIIGESVSRVFSNRSVDYRIDLANLLMRSIQCRSNSWGLRSFIATITASNSGADSVIFASFSILATLAPNSK